MQNSRCKMQTLSSRPLVLFAFCILHVALLLSLSGCSAKAKAQTLPDGPPLAVPVAPAHEIVIEQIAEAPPEPEPARVSEPVPAKSPPAVRTVPTQRQPPPNQPAATQPAPEPPAVRAAPAGAAGDDKKVRDLMQKATSDLKRVDYQKLSADGKSQYDQSKRFNDQAAQAIKERNFVYALTLAEKAATLAAELVR